MKNGDESTSAAGSEREDRARTKKINSRGENETKKKNNIYIIHTYTENEDADGLETGFFLYLPMKAECIPVGFLLLDPRPSENTRLSPHLASDSSLFAKSFLLLHILRMNHGSLNFIQIATITPGAKHGNG